MYQKQRVIIFIIFTIAVVCMSACGQKKDIKKYADMVAQAVNTNNMTDMQSMVMKNYTSNITRDEELADFFSDFQNENDGLIKKIIERDNVKVKNIKDNYIIYEIDAPRLDNMFEDILNNENIGISKFNKAIYDYIDNASLYCLEVNVIYSYKDNNFSAEYNTFEFINALTGGFIQSYRDLLNSLND